MYYAIKRNLEGKVISVMNLSKKYKEKFKDDPSNPLNQGYELVDSLEGLEFETPVQLTEKERILGVLGLAEEDIGNIKKLKGGN